MIPPGGYSYHSVITACFNSARARQLLRPAQHATGRRVLAAVSLCQLCAQHSLSVAAARSGRSLLLSGCLWCLPPACCCRCCRCRCGCRAEKNALPLNSSGLDPSLYFTPTGGDYASWQGKGEKVEVRCECVCSRASGARCCASPRLVHTCCWCRGRPRRIFSMLACAKQLTQRSCRCRCDRRACRPPCHRAGCRQVVDANGPNRDVVLKLGKPGAGTHVLSLPAGQLIEIVVQNNRAGAARRSCAVAAACGAGRAGVLFCSLLALCLLTAACAAAVHRTMSPRLCAGLFGGEYNTSSGLTSNRNGREQHSFHQHGHHVWMVGYCRSLRLLCWAAALLARVDTPARTRTRFTAARIDMLCLLCPLLWLLLINTGRYGHGRMDAGQGV